jgi:inosine-uridine nucleoside N-ribohydrolase
MVRLWSRIRWYICNHSAGKNKNIHLIGLSTSAGNSDLSSTTKNALDILNNIGRNDVPVIRGSDQLVFGKAQYAEEIHGEGDWVELKFHNLLIKPSLKIGLKLFGTSLWQSW